MRTHACPECGHEVRFNDELDGPVEHLPNGGHRWSIKVHVGLTLAAFKDEDR